MWQYWNLNYFIIIRKLAQNARATRKKWKKHPDVWFSYKATGKAYDNTQQIHEDKIYIIKWIISGSFSLSFLESHIRLFGLKVWHIQI